MEWFRGWVSDKPFTIIREIDCKAPRKVTNSRIKPATTTCP